MRGRRPQERRFGVAPSAYTTLLFSRLLIAGLVCRAAPQLSKNSDCSPDEGQQEIIDRVCQLLSLATGRPWVHCPSSFRLQRAISSLHSSAIETVNAHILVPGPRLTRLQSVIPSRRLYHLRLTTAPVARCRLLTAVAAGCRGQFGVFCFGAGESSVCSRADQRSTTAGSTVVRPGAITHLTGRRAAQSLSSGWRKLGRGWVWTGRIAG